MIVLNFIQGLEIKMTEDMGRGIFAAKDLRRGELLVVEKSIADAIDDGDELGIQFNYKNSSNIYDGAHREIVKKCFDLSRLQGTEAVRLSYLYAGGDIKDLKIPPISIFTSN